MVCVWNGVLFSHEKKGYPGICNNITEIKDIKWNKSHGEKQILHDLTYM